jgi:lysophospholipase L1-like esterase
MAFASLGVAMIVPAAIVAAAVISSPSEGSASTQELASQIRLFSPAIEPLDMGEALLALERTAEPEPPAASEAPAQPLEDRTSCEAIRGTDYRSDAERAWFQANCRPVVPTQQTQQQGANSAPERSVQPAGVSATGVRVTAIGDSVMLGAASQLAATIAGIDVDCAVGRQVSAAISVLRQRQAAGQLGPVVLMHVGNNGTFTEAQFEEIMSIAGPTRQVVFVNLRLPRSWEGPNNRVIAAGVARHANAYLVDWYGATAGQGHLFAADQVHLGPAGARYFAQLVAAVVN